MESVYHFVTIRVNETSWAHVWMLRSRYLGTGYDSKLREHVAEVEAIAPIEAEKQSRSAMEISNALVHLNMLPI
jgi:hypothetical protein